MKKLTFLVILLATFATGCTYYPTTPVTYGATTSVSKFDQSWSAAIGALSDEGVIISKKDRSAGIVQGKRSGIQVTGDVRTQADGSVRVQFNTSGATSTDPSLIDRVTQAYNRRMGR